VRPAGRRRWALAAAALAAALAVGGIWALSSSRGKLSLSLWSLDQAEERALRSVVAARPPAARAILRLRSEKPAHRAPEALAARMSLSLSYLSGGLAEVPKAALDSVPPSLLASCRDGQGRAFALPIQLDHYQVAYSYDLLEKSGLRARGKLSLGQLSSALQAYKDTRAPAILFAGGDDEALLLLVSALCESRGGLDAYAALVRAVRKDGSYETASRISLGRSPRGQDFTLGSLVDEIRSWKSKGYLHEEWFRLGYDDMRAYLSNGLGLVALAPLSFRRSVPYEKIDRYGWSPYPEEPGLARRAFVAPLTILAFGAGESAAAKEEARRELTAALLSPEAALAMAKATGRSTALAAAPAPDIQAADALAWAAGSDAVVNGIYRDAFETEAAAHSFAEALRAAARG
jgi:hypothetical protein